MGKVDVESVPFSAMDDASLQRFLTQNSISLKLDEARKIPSLIGRNPTITELHIFNTQWSEHSSYKSSKNHLKLLPTSGSDVILGPKEDAGIVFFTEHQEERYGIVISHESHNHPSQVVPYEGAATGIGGNVRDVLCMGARVIACADPLRFGNPYGRQKNKVRYIATHVIEGIAGYGNPLGVPIIAGDIYFNDSFDDNCLVNVVTLGIVKEKDIIHSTAPAPGYDLILIGKATDNSGFGGAAFSSLILNEEDRESNRGAVQVPDPFLKNVIIRATESVFKAAREKGIILGFKDLGAGGIMCCTSELVSSAHLGARINLDLVPVSMHDLPPYIIACSETQERFVWVSPPEFTPAILRLYNEDYELPGISEGAGATVIGKVTKEQDYILTRHGKIVCNAPAQVITEGVRYERTARKKERKLEEPVIDEIDYVKAVTDVLFNPSVASKAACYKHYDSEVQGLTVIRPGEADAGVQTPLAGCKKAIALSVDSNPLHARIDPYQGAANAVCESMRNIASVGAVPSALTDCLCYGNPEDEGQFWEFKEGIRGLKEAAEKLLRKGTSEPVPFISGNVSFYNENEKGQAVDPSAIVACLGIISDVSKVITMQIKSAGSILLLAGERKDELGGSAYYQTKGFLGRNVPRPDFIKEKQMIYSVIDAIDKRLLRSCHDISDGGMAACIAEMILGGEADGRIGAEINLGFSPLAAWKSLFSESSGFVMEISSDNRKKVINEFQKNGIPLIDIGVTGGDSLLIRNGSEKIADLPTETLREAWTTGFRRALE